MGGLFKEATRTESRLRLGLAGTSGAGKTFSALKMAPIFGKRIGVIDSERGSAKLYAGSPGIPPFRVLELGEERSPHAYLAALDAARDEGFDVVIIDSFSHSWSEALSIVDRMGGWVYAGKTVTPLVERIIDTIRRHPAHIIATMRMKAENVLEQNERGKTVIKKVGMKNVVRDGTEYEFDVMLTIGADRVITVDKTRCSALDDGLYTRDDFPKVARTLVDWLHQGAPRTAVESFGDRMYLARTLADLNSVAMEIKAAGVAGTLSDADRQALLDIYAKCKAALPDAPPPDEVLP